MGLLGIHHREIMQESCTLVETEVIATGVGHYQEARGEYQAPSLP
jgi:hypothetical protein